MKRRQEEELIQMAFGEMPESALECPDAEAKLRSYCELRRGLQSLKDIPEMQMSSERLRDAILNGGLKPKPEPKLGLSWLAAAAALCVVGYMGAARMGRTDAGATAIKQTPIVVETPVALDWPPTQQNFDADRWLGGPENVLMLSAAPVTRKINSPERSARLSPSRPIDRVTPVAESPTVVETKPNLKSAFQATPSAQKDSLTTEPEVTTSDIVVIDAQAQNDEGISQAKEVKSSANVVIGG
ncbi:MAG: hypothetical protein ABL949_01455 [Fimbriimonadaceae bacterium]